MSLHSCLLTVFCVHYLVWCLVFAHCTWTCIYYFVLYIVNYYRWPALMGVCLFWQPAIDGCYLILCFKVVWQNKFLSCLVFVFDWLTEMSLKWLIRLTLVRVQIQNESRFGRIKFTQNSANKKSPRRPAVIIIISLIIQYLYIAHKFMKESEALGGD